MNGIALKHLQQNCKKINYFGLGMIQVNMNNGLRYNFYTDKVAATIPQGIHSHRYDFSSKIIAGTLVQTHYKAYPDDEGDFIESRVNCQEVCTKTEVGRVSLSRINTQFLGAGSTYFARGPNIHSVHAPTGCITLITRESREFETCSVFNKIGELRGEAFVSYPEHSLWNYVEDMINEYFN